MGNVAPVSNHNALTSYGLVIKLRRLVFRTLGRISWWGRSKARQCHNTVDVIISVVQMSSLNKPRNNTRTHVHSLNWICAPVSMMDNFVVRHTRVYL